MPPQSTPALVLLTATITPSTAVPNLTVRSTQDRLEQYLATLRQVLALPRDVVGGVVLAENSGHDLAPFRAVAAGRPDVELLSVDMTGEDQGAGRGWLETTPWPARWRSPHRSRPRRATSGR